MANAAVRRGCIELVLDLVAVPRAPGASVAAAHGASGFSSGPGSTVSDLISGSMHKHTEYINLHLADDGSNLVRPGHSLGSDRHVAHAASASELGCDSDADADEIMPAKGSMRQANLQLGHGHMSPLTPLDVSK